MVSEVSVNQFSISTVSFFTPEGAFRTAAQLNSRGEFANPVDVEIHTTKDMTPEFLRSMKGKYPLVSVSSVHLEVPYSEFEIDYQVSHQGKDNFHLSPWSPLAHRIIYAKTGVAESMNGLDLTESFQSRIIDANLHINTLIGFYRAGRLGNLQQRRHSVTVENSVRHDFLYGGMLQNYTPDMMYDPRRVIEVMNGLGLHRFRLGLDHLTTHLDRQDIRPHDVLEDDLVKRQTIAVNLAGAGNGQIDYTDPYWESLFNKIGATDFVNPIRGIFTFSPIAALKGAIFEQGYANFYARNISEVIKRQEN